MGFGNSLRLILASDQVHDEVSMPIALNHGSFGDYLMADKAYGSGRFRSLIDETNMIAVIPSNKSRPSLF